MFQAPYAVDIFNNRHLLILDRKKLKVCLILYVFPTIFSSVGASNGLVSRYNTKLIRNSAAQRGSTKKRGATKKNNNIRLLKSKTAFISADETLIRFKTFLLLSFICGKIEDAFLWIDI